MNKKMIYIVVAVIVVVLVVGVAGVMLLNNNGNNGNTDPTPTPGPIAVADATSLQFSVEDSTGTYIYYADNIGSETQLAISYVDETAGFTIIMNGTAHTANSNMTGTWAEDDFQTTWDQWYPLFEGYVDSLAHWTEGEWTSEDGTTRIFDISVNPELDDSCFEVPS
jgi:hypothetical protein